jgi:hypothetical protein
MRINDRIELRIETDTKEALALRAEAEGVPVSTLLRRAIRTVLNRPQPLSQEQAGEVAALRARVNAIDNRLEVLGGRPGVASARSDAAQARIDAHSLLGRG